MKLVASPAGAEKLIALIMQILFEAGIPSEPSVVEPMHEFILILAKRAISIIFLHLGRQILLQGSLRCPGLIPMTSLIYSIGPSSFTEVVVSRKLSAFPGYSPQFDAALLRPCLNLPPYLVVFC